MDTFSENLKSSLAEAINGLDRDYHEERRQLCNALRALGVEPPAMPLRGRGRPRKDEESAAQDGSHGKRRRRRPASKAKAGAKS